MKDFFCSSCENHLRVGENIVLKIRKANNRKALLLLNPQIGNYDSIKHSDFKISNGEPLEFYCPLCNASLKSDIHPNLIHVRLRDDERRFFDVYFSRVKGERCTYETSNEILRIEGEDAGKYTYFRIRDKYKKYFQKRNFGVNRMLVSLFSILR